MQYILHSSEDLQALIHLPSSKSISNRVLILHALSGGDIRPDNLSDCDDTHVMVRALEHPSDIVDIGAAGTAMRFLTAYLSVTPGIRLLTGTSRMQQRPIGILVDALRSLGAQIEYAGQEGFPPLRITGTRLGGQEVSMAGHVSSQYISALLMIGPVLPGGLTLHLTGNIISRPYINLTLRLMSDFGARAEWAAPDCIRVYPGAYQDRPFRVESDWSAASYWYEIMALMSATGGASHRQGAMEIVLPGLLEDSYQGDSHGATLFARLGVQTDFTPQGGVVLHPGQAPDTHLEADLVNIPDLAQTFVVTCCLLGVTFRFTGLQSLKIKETDRLSALVTELRKLGYVLRCEQDRILVWEGERCPAQQTPVIDTYEDHRMAMAFAPACIRVPGLRIAEPKVVSKSYPHFWEDLRKVGFRVEEA